MARPFNIHPDIIHVSIFDTRKIIASMNDEELGRWIRKAFDDMSIGCDGKDVDPRVLAVYQDASGRMKARQNAQLRFRESRKAGTSANRESTTSVSTEVLDAVKRDDQLIYGHFENVFLSQAEFNELANMLGNINDLNSMIEDFSAALSDGTRHSRNHFATLSYWINYRRKMGEKEGTSVHSGGCGFEQHNLRALEKANRQIDEMVRKGLLK